MGMHSVSRIIHLRFSTNGRRLVSETGLTQRSRASRNRLHDTGTLVLPVGPQSLQDMRAIYAVQTPEAGEEALRKWINKNPYSPTAAIRSIAKTVVQWREPI